MTGWSLSLFSQNVTKEDMRSITANLFFLSNYYKYKDDDQKVYGALSAMPFMDKVKDTWNLLCLVPEDGYLNENMIEFTWH
eukprot:7374972-Ditylum_brightwellii.AAC.1